MKKENKQKIVPAQEEGTETGAKQETIATTAEEAHKIFTTAKNRLLTIEHWSDYSKIAIAKTMLCDDHGALIGRKPEIGDYIRIDLAGPGPKAGDGYDWVRIEEMKDCFSLEEDEESFAFRVRPASNPSNPDGDVSHFYTSDATSTFIIERKGKKVSASEIGRNEIPNTDTEKTVDNVRNAVVAAGGRIGLSSAQWSLLMAGILESPVKM
ncbi:MAG TPA: hypothetical protein VGC65_02850 [Bacteroidia bacterium]|jgi:hypothetical protein